MAPKTERRQMKEENKTKEGCARLSLLSVLFWAPQKTALGVVAFLTLAQCVGFVATK